MRAALLALALAGCLDSAPPDVGPPLRPACDDADRDPAVVVSYRDVVDGVFRDPAYDCVKCHTEGGATPLGLLVGGLDLGSYDGLRRGGNQSGGDVVIPGAPCRSALYRKVLGGPPFGARMPLDGPPYLGDEELDLIHDWIAEGAHAE